MLNAFFQTATDEEIFNLLNYYNIDKDSFTEKRAQEIIEDNLQYIAFTIDPQFIKLYLEEE